MFNSQPLRKWRIVPRGSFIADEPGFLGICCQHVKSKPVNNLQLTTILSVERGWTLARSWNEPRWAPKMIIECIHVFLSSWPINWHHWPGTESSPESQVEASVVHDILHSVDESILHTLHSFKYVLDSDTLRTIHQSLLNWLNWCSLEVADGRRFWSFSATSSLD